MNPLLQYIRQQDSDRDPGEVGELTLLCERQNLSLPTVIKMIYRFEHPDCIDGPLRSMDFNIADKLLCGADLYDMWRGELHDYYYGVDLTWRKCEAPLCEKMFQQGRVTQGPTVKRYCSKACADADSRLRTGQVESRRRNYGSRLAPRKGNKCRNGHDRTPENTKHRGNGKMECLLCHRASAKRAYRRKMDRQKGLVAQAA